MLATTVTSVSGSVPMMIVAPMLAVGFGIRFFGNSLAMSRGEWGMPWGGRIGSWVPFGVVAYLMWTAGSLASIAAYAAFLVLDGASGFVKREGGTPRAPVNLRPVWIGTGITIYLAFTAIFYLLVGRYFVYGVLTTWTILALGFAILLRVTMAGPKAGEGWLRAPADHKRHERRETAIVDPQRARAEDVLLAFRARGDAGPFLALVREAAVAADLKEEDARALEQRILASFARVGTRRDEDLVAALDEIEKIMALRGRPIPLKKETSL